MVCSFVDAPKIKEWIEICQMMKLFDTMVCFKFTTTELTIQMVHMSKRCVVEMKFPSTWFSTYEWTDMEFYIDTESIHTIFSLYSGEKMISMECEKRYMTVKMFHDDQKKHFSIPINLQNQSQLVIQPEEGFHCKISPSYFSALCEQLSQFGNTVSFFIKKDLFHLTTYRSEKMLVEVNPERIEVITEGDAEGYFELYYLNLFLKFATFHDSVHLKINEFLHFSLEKEYTVHYYVSPNKN